MPHIGTKLKIRAATVPHALMPPSPDNTKAACQELLARTMTPCTTAEKPKHLAEALRFLRITALFLVLTGIYEFSRYLAAPGAPLVPLRHARSVISFERALGLFVEPQLQSWIAGLPAIQTLAVWIYSYEHLAGSIAFLIWLWLMRPVQFPFVWRWFWIAHALALVGFWLYPLAPPRLLPELGLADPTAAQLASSPGASQFAHIRNDFAAMPSLHVGYPLIFAIVIWFALPHTQMRWLVWLWPLTIMFVVMATANHYWLDSVGGAFTIAAALAIALALFRDLPRPWTKQVRLE